ncbi:Crp/Fnr family transcriptional regulator [Cereibacter azotoformans]|uniref:CRP/FNR family transcriptional regulator n=2 Tax=Cereibacter TaxID=1653176 RepID=A0A2T5KB61_9RHOB|nr:Crp/Fnr family transcriptional regulator [Cereibacter azotoformans]AXQ93863.1 Crp/Fnr family transcriptional regulator [Cereibacter sphaeroides]MBO4168331.1 Crp/Fnr family transcriptional regulator [Cereibacter azotoformans]PTR19646.1 CRP/FNR family transcriptional regulator [Cereibacter azotoformans]UIJ29378.1 Crp/Fnr family transcriptional regulator [Cereibacter azotoformans]ULB10088.1 Crp/Fnr family transcriptional regulator [Cereibacter azotoformans]
MERPLVSNEVTRLGPDAKFHHAGLRRGLTPSTLRKLDAIARLRVFPRDSVVVPQGGALEYVGNVVRGVLRMERLLADGRSQIVGLLVPSDMFGRVFSDRSDYSIEAATEVTLCCFERHAFESLVRSCPDLEHAVLLAVLDELDAAREWITLRAGATVAARLATYLLMLCRRWPHQTSELTGDQQRIIVNVPIARNDLALYLGTTVESISRAVQGFSRDGLISIRTPLRFEITDLPALIALSENEEFDAAALLTDLRAGCGGSF